MAALIDPENVDIITFLPDGQFFAIRVNEFSSDLLYRLFALSSFDDFLELLQVWGFDALSNVEEEAVEEDTRGTGISQEHHLERGIQVFRHPRFRKGADIDLRHPDLPQTCPSGVVPCSDPPQMPVLPEEASFEQRTVDNVSAHSSKRRLSPSHDACDRALEGIKQPAFENEDFSVPPAFASHHRPSRRRSSLEIRSKALAVTAAQLRLDDRQPSVAWDSKSSRRASLSLVDGGVDKATHNIVTDAIETLLFDEHHTRKTYLKHEEKLSISSLPGVVPISKLLFSPCTSDGSISGMNTSSRLEQIASAAHALYPDKGVSPLSSNLWSRDISTVSPAQLDAAAALVKQAGLKDDKHPVGVWNSFEVTTSASSKAHVVQKEDHSDG